MPRFFFDVDDGQGVVADTAGQDLIGLEAARDLAYGLANEALGAAGEPGRDFTLVVRDARRHSVMTLHASAPPEVATDLRGSGR